MTKQIILYSWVIAISAILSLCFYELTLLQGVTGHLVQYAAYVLLIGTALFLFFQYQRLRNTLISLENEVASTVANKETDLLKKFAMDSFLGSVRRHDRSSEFEAGVRVFQLPLVNIVLTAIIMAIMAIGYIILKSLI